MSETSPRFNIAHHVQSENFDWQKTLGGWRGVGETLAPTLLFLVSFTVTKNLWLAAILSAIPIVIMTLWRLIAREPLTQIFGGAFGLIISLIWVLWSGRETNFFAFSLVTASMYCLVFLVSILMKNPLIGVGFALLGKFPHGWQRQARYAGIYHASLTATWYWVGLFFTRLLIMTPLWWANYFEVLGIAKLILGLPLSALVTWLTWLTCKPYSALLSNETSKSEATSSITEAK